MGFSIQESSPSSPDCNSQDSSGWQCQKVHYTRAMHVPVGDVWLDWSPLEPHRSRLDQRHFCDAFVFRFVFSGHKGEAEPVGGNGEEKASDEWTILDGEEHISDLLVTVAQLHVKMESLQPRKGR